MKEKIRTGKTSKLSSTSKIKKEARQERLPDTFKKHSFFEDVWDVVRLVPKGRVTSYGAIAKYLGTGMSARMVGWAMNAAGYAEPAIAAHRVLNRNGMLSGKAHFHPPEKMENLLKNEGVQIENDTVVDLPKHYWDPAVELA